MNARPQQELQSPAPLSVLLVDDDRTQVEFIKQTFETDPTEIAFAIASTSAEANRGLHDHIPGGVIIDFRLPDGSGVELLSTAAYPVIILTGHEMRRDRH